MDTYRLFFKSMLNIMQQNNNEWLAGNAGQISGNLQYSVCFDSHIQGNHEC